MTYTTHIMGGVLLGVLLSNSLGADSKTAVIISGAAAIGSLLPDIDHPRSKISNSNIATQVTSGIVSIFTNHRGFFHTIPFVLIVYVILTGVGFFDVVKDMDMLKGIYKYIPFSISLGMLSHLILDTLNPGGIMWLWPIKTKRYHMAEIRTNSILEALTAFILFITIIIIFPEAIW